MSICENLPAKDQADLSNSPLDSEEAQAVSDEAIAEIAEESTSTIEKPKKQGALTRLKGFFVSKKTKQLQKLLENEERAREENKKRESDYRVAATLEKIDDQLNSLIEHNLALLKQIDVLRSNNERLLKQIDESRRRQTINKVIAIISSVVSGALIVLKLLNSFGIYIFGII